MAPSIMYMKRSDRLWNKFLTDLRTDQHTAEDSFSDGQGGRFYPGDGLMPSQSPCYIPNVLPVPGMGSFMISFHGAAPVSLVLTGIICFMETNRSFVIIMRQAKISGT